MGTTNDENKNAQYFEKQYKEAQDMLKDVDKTEEFLQKLEHKLKSIPVAGDALADVPLLISLVRMYINKEYTEIPIASIISIVAALIYLLSPVDIIPDVIPVVGYTDDALVVSACLMLVRTDIEDYKVWRQEKGMEICDFPNYENLAKKVKENNKIYKAFFKGREMANRNSK